MKHGDRNLLADQPLDDGDGIEEEVNDTPEETSVNGVTHHSSKNRQDEMDGTAVASDDDSVTHFIVPFLLLLLHREILVRFQNRSNFSQLCLLRAFFLRY